MAEYTTALGCRFARDAEKLGADGLMVLPAMVYKSDERETLAHFRAVAARHRAAHHGLQQSGLLRRGYAAGGVRATGRCANLVAIKESSENVRRITDLRNLTGDRYILFGGVDDLVLESVLLGAEGWVSGLVNAFPDENHALWDLATARPLGGRRANFTAGTCRCCTWTRR